MKDRIFEVKHSKPPQTTGTRRDEAGEGDLSCVRAQGGFATLKSLLASERKAIVERWVDRAAQAYPPEAAPLLKREGDRFGNPVGHALTTGIGALFDGLLSDASPEQLGSCLEPILKIRSVQSLSPSRALTFVIELKGVILDQLGDAIRRPGRVEEWFAIEARIDQLTLLAFDIFTRWREIAHEIRVREIQRRVSGYLRRLELGQAGPAPGGVPAPGEGLHS